MLGFGLWWLGRAERAARRAGEGFGGPAPAAMSASAAAQERGPTPISRDDLRAAIGRLGDLDYPSRMRAGRAVRRAPEALAVPELLEAVREHADGYIRFKALVLLTGLLAPPPGGLPATPQSDPEVVVIGRTSDPPSIISTDFVLTGDAAATASAPAPTSSPSAPFNRAKTTSA